MLSKFKQALVKNMPEIQAFSTGGMPSFVYGIKKFKDIPVFCLHSASYIELEKQLIYLKDNSYKTLICEEMVERLKDPGYKNNGKEIVITFDDGMSSTWTTAFPLFRKYDFRFVSFILPGLTEDGDSVGDTIDDVSESDRDKLSERDYSSEPLCNWKEIEVMHESGVVDIQSHGMQHALISTGSRLVDFVHPGFDAYHYGNIHIPVFEYEGCDGLRGKIYGHPIYENDSRFSGKPRYFDSPILRKGCAEYVESHGGVYFFRNGNWRKRLRACFNDIKDSCPGGSEGYESPDEIEAAITWELKQSKKEIESRLSKNVRNFCFPWFRLSETSAHLAKQCEYDAIYLGATVGFERKQGVEYPITITRLQQEFLSCLPGKGGGRVSAVLMKKAFGRMGKKERV